ncbi:MAG: response regulator [Candidatus Marinimicrobia bacterium]|nr:response regulator [Candidatus Neomarinimicrobiota bacterium]
MKPGILFLDDDLHLLKSIQRFLNKYVGEWNIHFNTSFEAALETLTQEKIDVAFLDINLPQKNGFELLNHIKKSDTLKNIEIVMITGMEDEELKREALNYGATDLLQKPVQPEDLIARIKATLKTKLFHDELVKKNILLSEQLIASQKMEITGVLAAGIIHDIRNIFNVIQNYPVIIKSKLEKNEVVEKELEKIQFAASRAESILRQILIFSKHEERKDNFITDINVVVKDTLTLLEPTLPYNIELVNNLNEGALVGNFNATLLTQMIMNLVINAKEAIGRGKGKIEISTSREVMNDRTYFVLRIMDNGPGIPEAIQSKIFNNRVSTKQKGRNFGFGLSIVSLLAEKLKGKIEVKSKLGYGTTFIIYLPSGE